MLAKIMAPVAHALDHSVGHRLRRVRGEAELAAAAQAVRDRRNAAEDADGNGLHALQDPGLRHHVECRREPPPVLGVEQRVVLEVIVAVAAQHVEQHAAKQLFPVARVRGAVPAQHAGDLHVRALHRGLLQIEQRERADEMHAGAKARRARAIEAPHQYGAPAAADLDQLGLRGFNAAGCREPHGCVLGGAFVDLVVVALKFPDPELFLVLDHRFRPHAAEALAGPVEGKELRIGIRAPADRVERIRDLAARADGQEGGRGRGRFLASGECEAAHPLVAGREQQLGRRESGRLAACGCASRRSRCPQRSGVVSASAPNSPPRLVAKKVCVDRGRLTGSSAKARLCASRSQDPA